MVAVHPIDEDRLERLARCADGVTVDGDRTSGGEIERAFGARACANDRADAAFGEAARARSPCGLDYHQLVKPARRARWRIEGTAPGVPFLHRSSHIGTLSREHSSCRSSSLSRGSSSVPRGVSSNFSPTTTAFKTQEARFIGGPGRTGPYGQTIMSGRTSIGFVGSPALSFCFVHGCCVSIGLFLVRTNLVRRFSEFCGSVTVTFC